MNRSLKVETLLMVAMCLIPATVLMARSDMGGVRDPNSLGGGGSAPSTSDPRDSGSGGNYPGLGVDKSLPGAPDRGYIGGGNYPGLGVDTSLPGAPDPRHGGGRDPRSGGYQSQVSHGVICVNAAGRAISNCAKFAGSVIACETARTAPNLFVKAVAGVVCATHVFPAMDCTTSGAKAVDTCFGRSSSEGFDHSSSGPSDHIGSNGDAGSLIGD